MQDIERETGELCYFPLLTPSNFKKIYKDHNCKKSLKIQENFEYVEIFQSIISSMRYIERENRVLLFSSFNSF